MSEDVMETVRRHMRERGEIEDRLMAERVRLVEAIAEIDKMLAEIQTKKTKKRRARSGPVVAAILAVLERNPGASRSEVEEGLVAARPGTTTGTLNSALHRLLEARRVRTEGPRGSMRFFLCP